MAEITAAQVKNLRDRTGAGMMDCKKALTEAEGDMEAAVDNLRKAGVLKAGKKAGRETTEGRIVIHRSDSAVVMVELLCETDFVAKNEQFAAFADAVAERIAGYSETGDVVQTGTLEEANGGTLVNPIVGSALATSIRIVSTVIAPSSSVTVSVTGCGPLSAGMNSKRESVCVTICPAAGLICQLMVSASASMNTTPWASVWRRPHATAGACMHILIEARMTSS